MDKKRRELVRFPRTSCVTLALSPELFRATSRVSGAQSYPLDRIKCEKTPETLGKETV